MVIPDVLAGHDVLAAERLAWIATHCDQAEFPPAVRLLYGAVGALVAGADAETWHTVTAEAEALFVSVDFQKLFGRDPMGFARESSAD